ncbi:MAG: hypothetical protein ACPLW9_00445, partial [Minisyncoccales bacterium]
QCQLEFEDSSSATPTEESINQILTTLKDKCNEIKEENPTTTDEKGNIIPAVPESCQWLALFVGNEWFPILKEDEIHSSSITRGGQSSSFNLIDFPLAKLGCSNPSSLPKITFPAIKIPDIEIMKDYINLCLPLIGGVKFKLPKISFEPLKIPDFNLCNLDQCGNFFPGFNFSLPRFSLPDIIIPAIDLPDYNGFKMPRIELETMEFYPIYLSLLGGFNLPEILMPELTIQPPSLPELNFNFDFEMQINYEALAQLAMKMFLDLAGIDLSSQPNCVEGEFKLGQCLDISYPDITISWPAFPQIPEIPFCQDINNFCLEMKKGIANVLTELNQIQKTINQTLQNQVQKPLDDLAKAVNKEITKQIIEQFNDRAKDIETAIKDALDKNLPFVHIELDDITISAIDLNKLVDWPNKIEIPWPTKLKKIPCSITFHIPTIPLSQLSYNKEIHIDLPSFQSPTGIELELKQSAFCEVNGPTPSNPCPQQKISDKVESIKDLKEDIQKASQEVLDILE